MRASGVLIGLAAAALAAVLWLALSDPPTPPSRASSPGPASGARVGPPQSQSPPRPAEPTERAPAATEPAPTARATADREDLGLARLPRTGQSVHARVMLPTADGLRFTDAIGTVRDAAGAILATAPAERDGRLLLELERPLAWGFLEVTHPALVPARVGPFDVSLGERRLVGVLRLEPGQVRSVRVRTPEGLDAEGARVWLLPAPGRAAGPLEPLVTDREGRVGVVVPWQVGGLFVRHRDAVAHLSELPPRGQVEIEVALGAERTPLRGRVLDRASGEGLAGARIELLYGNSLLFVERADPEGRFDLGQGYDQAFSLRLSAEGFQTRRVDGPARLGFELDAAIYPLVPAADAPFASALASADEARRAVRLRVVDSDGAPLPEAVAELRRPPVGDTLVWIDPRLDVPAAVQRADADGRIAFTRPVELADSAVVRASGHVASFVTELERSAGRELEVRLAAGTELSGTVLAADGRPVPGCQVLVGVRGARVVHATDADGRFRIAGLPLERVTVRAPAPRGFEHLGASEELELDLSERGRPLLRLSLRPDGAGEAEESEDAVDER